MGLQSHRHCNVIDGLPSGSALRTLEPGMRGTAGTPYNRSCKGEHAGERLDEAVVVIDGECQHRDFGFRSI